MIAALVDRGHVLFGTCPAGQDGARARDRRQSIGARAPPAIQCTPDLQPTDVSGLSVYNQGARVRVPAGAALREHRARRRDQPRDAEDAVGAARGDGGAQITVDGTTRALPEPFLMLATREPDRARGHLPAAGGPARPLHGADEASATRTRRRAARRRAPSGTRTRSTGLAPCGRPRRDRGRWAAPRARRLRRRPGSSAGSWSSSAPRCALEVVEVGGSVRGSLALEAGRPGLGAPPRPDVRASPTTSSELFVPVLAPPRPAARTELRRRRPREPGAGRASRGRCLELVPGARLGLAAAGVARNRKMRARRVPAAALPRRRGGGLAFGGAPELAPRRTARDVAGSRPYQRGDPVAQRSTGARRRGFRAARGRREFIVRECFSEEAPRVVVVRRPAAVAGAQYLNPFPWLSTSRARWRRRPS